MKAKKLSKFEPSYRKVGAVLVGLLTLLVAFLLLPDQFFTASAAPSQQATTPTPAPACPPGASGGCILAPVTTVAAGSLNLAGSATITPSLSQAANSGVKMTIEAGIGPEGYARGGSWIPVYITLENSGQNAQGELVITVAPTQNQPDYTSNQRGVQLYSSLYVQQAELANGARKKFVMYLPYPANDLFNRTVAVEYNGVQGSDSQPKNLALATAELKPLLNQLLVGYLAGNPAALRPYDDIVLSNAQNTNSYGKGAPTKHLRLTALDPAHLPGISQALGSLNVLVLQDFDPASLSAEQWGSVESWVRQGGVLLLSGGTSASRVLKGLPASLQPTQPPTSADLVELDPASQKALEKLGKAPLPETAAGAKSYITLLKPVSEATSLISSDEGLPLALELKLGAGAAVVTAFDLAEPRFSGWDGSPDLWETLVGAYQNAIQQFGPYSAYGINSTNILSGGLTSVLTNIPGVGIPSLKIIGVLALIYIIVVGPINYLVLRRLRRLELSWLTLPLLTVLFAGGIYLFALKDKGTELLTSSVSVIRLTQNDNQATGAVEKPALSLIGVFTPNDNSYLLNLPGNSLSSAIPNYTYLPPVAPPAQPGQIQPTPVPLSLPAPPVGLRIIEGSQPQVQLVNMAQWSFRSVVTEGNVKLAGGLKGDFVQQDNKLSGTLTNNTGQTLSDVTVLTAFGMAQFGTLAPGQTVQVSLDNVYGASSPLFTLYQNNQALAYRGGAAPQSGGTPQERAIARKRDLLNSLSGSLPFFNSSGYNPNFRPQSSPSGVAVLGWSDTPLLDYAVNGRKVGGNDLTLFVADMPVDLSRSTQLLPGTTFGKVSEKIALPVTNPAPSAPSNPGAYLPPTPLNGAALDAGSVTVDFELPGLVSTLRGGKQLKELVIEAPAFAFNRNGYGPQQAPKYSAELYNYQTNQWDAIPVVLAPTACLKQAPAYSGGPVTAPMTGLAQPGPNASPACANAFGKVALGVATPTPSPAKANPSPAASVTGTSVSRGPAPTATPQPTTLPAYYPGGPADGFLILQPGPNFDPAQYLSSEGKVRARYSRDQKSTDTVYWNYFSIGYELFK